MAATTARALRFVATEDTGEVSALLHRPRTARALLVLGHGAGAGMRHAFMEAVTLELATRSIATLRYQFPYMERGRRPPNTRAVLTSTVRSAIAAAGQVAADLPLLAGGKSMGGRMTSLAAAEEPLAGVRGLVFLGFPLHAAGKPAGERADHLASVHVPMLFLQGDRDPLASLDLLRPICSKLGRRAQLHIVDGGDHSFHVLKRSDRSDEDALRELGEVLEAWTAKLI